MSRWRTIEFIDQIIPRGMGVELVETMEYISDPGYSGLIAASACQDVFSNGVYRIQ